MSKKNIKAPLNPFDVKLQITNSGEHIEDHKREITIIDVGPTFLKMNDAFHKLVKEQQTS